MSLSYIEAREIIVGALTAGPSEAIPLAECFGRVLAQEVRAKWDVPAFDRSPLDGYAFRAEDTATATRENPVALKVIENIPAGQVSHFPITEGTAVRLMTGAPIPEGANAIINYEATEFTDTEVKLFKPYKAGDNVIYAGEDVKAGTLLADAGMRIDAGLMGTLAAQNISRPQVFKKLRAGIISTGSELIEVGSEIQPGMIYDSNQFTLTGVMASYGCEPVGYGIVRDDMESITAAIVKALEECDVVLLTGGASVGDYDLTPAAMANAGVNVLFRGVALKPGMACAYGVKDNKLVCGLSGNPSSSITNLYLVGIPGILKMSGVKDVFPKEIEVTLKNGFGKPSKVTRILKGRIVYEDGLTYLDVHQGQGNVVLSSLIGCNCLGIIPAGSGPVEAGTKLKGIIL